MRTLVSSQRLKVALFRRILAVGCFALCGFARGAVAQIGGQTVPRLALDVTVDGGYLPDDLALRCDPSDGAPSIGGGVSLVFRPMRWLLLQSDTRASAVLPAMGCKTVIPPVPVPAGFVIFPTKVFPDGAPRTPLWRSALRVGIETPPDRPLLRATVGGGAIWTGGPTAFESATIGVGTRGRAARLLVEVEVGTARFRIAEEKSSFVDPDPYPGRSWEYVTTSKSRVVRPVWATVHAGVEFPLGRRAGNGG